MFNGCLLLGDKLVPYHEDFRLYITTKLHNPSYTHELATKLTILNFSLTPRRLEDQLMCFISAEETSDLEDTRNCLITNNARLRREMKEIENTILFKLSNNVGDIVEDVELIDALQTSKVKYQEILNNVSNHRKVNPILIIITSPSILILLDG